MIIIKINELGGECKIKTMSNSVKNIYICTNCDAQTPKWSGRCLECGSWGTLEKQTISKEKNMEKSLEYAPAEIINFDNLKNKNLERFVTGVGEIDRVLGGGLVPGSLILISGEPGIGKSTMLAQIANLIAKKSEKDVIYVSGEESGAQVKDRLERLSCNTKKIEFIGDTNTEKICASIIKNKPSLVIVDSIQTVRTNLVPSEAGSINQIRASTVKFLEVAKEHDVTIILVGHITKDGQVAGPKSLEHIVDTVIYLENDPSHNYRILRAAKNRFGSVNELGVFEMTGGGFCEIKNPSAVFLDDHDQKISGSVVSCVIEGTRPFLVEIQALVSKTVFGYPVRKASGFDLNRLQVIAAVLTKRAGVNLTNQDIVLNIVGGLKINDPSLDLAVCAAIISSLLNQTFDPKTIVLGEVGLGGEVRNIARLGERLKEAEKLGFKDAVTPNVTIEKLKLSQKKIKNLEELVRYIT